MNLRARRATSGPNICNAMGAESTTLATMSASTLKGLLSKAQGKCGYFSAKSIDQTAPITLMTDDES
uniref:Uncharacterized protein n=1 Tax=Romanomermis culicivorax TaxID=13658 RepID=A0A915JJ47_ROMCU